MHSILTQLIQSIKRRFTVCFFSSQLFVEACLRDMRSSSLLLASNMHRQQRQRDREKEKERDRDRDRDRDREEREAEIESQDKAGCERPLRLIHSNRILFAPSEFNSRALSHCCWCAGLCRSMCLLVSLRIPVFVCLYVCIFSVGLIWLL